MTEFGSVEVVWDDKTYLFDPKAVNVRQATVIHGYTGMGMVSWDKAVSDAQPKACVALAWLMFDQAGEKRDITGFDEFPIVAFMAAYNDGLVAWVERMVEAEQAKEKQARPKAGSRAAARRTVTKTRTSDG